MAMAKDEFPKRQRTCPSCGAALTSEERVVPAWVEFWRCPDERKTFVEPISHSVIYEPAPVSEAAFEAASRLPSELVDSYGHLFRHVGETTVDADAYGDAIATLAQSGRAMMVIARGARTRSAVYETPAGEHYLEVLKKTGMWKNIPLGDPVWARLVREEIDAVRATPDGLDALAERVTTHPDLFEGRLVDRFEWDRIAKTLAPIP